MSAIVYFRAPAFLLCAAFFLSPIQSAFAQFADINAGLTAVGDATVGWVDYDLDRDMDVLIAGESATGPVTRLYQNNNGTFTYIDNTPFIGISIGDFAFGDFDNDNDPDLILTGQKDDGAATTQVYRNDNGTFVDINAGITALKAGIVDWADFDSDGDLDFVINGVGEDDLTITKIFSNTGNGTFEDAGISLQGLRRGQGGWIDFDLDGDPDLLLSGRDTQNQRHTILYLNDNGAFTESDLELPQVDLSAIAWGKHDDARPRGLAISGTSDTGITSAVFSGSAFYLKRSDFALTNLDIPALEFAAAAYGNFSDDFGAELVIMGRDDQGTPVTQVLYAGLSDPAAGLAQLYKGDAAWGDMDGDGDLDLLLAGFDAQDAPVTRIYEVEGKAFTPEQPYYLRTSPNGNSTALRWIEALNKTGEIGYMTYNLRVGTTPGGSEIVSPLAFDDGQLMVPRAGNVGDAQTYVLDDLPAGTYYWTVQSVDYAFTGSPFAPEQAFEVTYTDLFSDAGIAIDLPAVASDIRAKREDLFWADVDSDGDLDIVTATDIYANQNGQFQATNAGVTNAELFSDIDNDGDLDIIGYALDESAIYWNTPTGFEKQTYEIDEAFQFADYQFFEASTQRDASAMADIDNDGDEDLIISSDRGFLDGATGALYQFENVNGALATSGIGWGSVFSLGEPVAADYDADGDFDFLFSGYENDIYKFWISSLIRNEGNESQPVGFYRDRGASSAGLASWRDVDLDGNPDFVVTGPVYDNEGRGINPEQTTFFENDGGTFVESGYILAPNNGNHAWGDYDNDGDPDLLTGNDGFLSPVHTPIFEHQNGDYVNVVQTLDDYKVQYAYFGDYDNDDDLDILAVVANEDESLTARVFKNNSVAKNDAPTAPAGLLVSINDDIVTFSWDAANDEETPTQALTYNLRIGTTPGGSEIMSAPALSDGTLLLPREGNVRQNTSWPIRNLAEGTYYWSVQAVDQGYKGSAFSAEQMVSLPDGTIPVELTGFEGKLNGDHIALRWHTASETNNAGFSVERAIDGGTFESRAFIEGQGTTTLPQSYRFEDDLLGLAREEIHYRLKQIDFDGAFAYSDVITIALPIPEETALLPNHPNPFNPVTTINYTLALASQVEVHVYDLTGKRIKTLVSGFQNAGRQRAAFNGEGLASGVYVTVLRTENTVDMRKILLIK